MKTDNGKRSRRPKGEWIRIEVPHLAIIDKETFKRAQARAERNSQLAARNWKNQYLLTGHFRCARCNKVMIDITKDPDTKPRKFYRCSSSMRKGLRCDNAKKQVVMEKIDDMVWGWVNSFMTDEETLEAGIRTMIDQRKDELEQKQGRLKTLENLLLKADTRIHRLVNELSQYDGVAVLAAIREKIKDTENEKNLLLEEHSRLSMELETLELPPDFDEQVRNMVMEAREEIGDASFESKRSLLEKLNVQVLYHRDPETSAIRLDASCIIPQFNSAIETSPSPK